MERGDSLLSNFIIYVQEFILELAASDFRVINFNEEVGEREAG